MKQFLLTLMGVLASAAILAQSQPSAVCTSPATFTFDQEITWYWNLDGNTKVAPGDPVYFYSWAPAGSQGSLQLTYEKDMIWSLTWTPTDYYGVDLATLETEGNAAFWHSLTTTGNVSVTGTVDFSIKEMLRLGSTCACMLPDPRESYTYFFDFGKNDVTNGNETTNPDTNGNYWNNISNASSGTAYDVISNTNMPGSAVLTLNSTFGSNGILNGGLLSPDPALLGEYAIASATQDYFFTSSSTGIGFTLSGLDQTKTYTFGFFGSRTSSERISSYTITGANGSISGNLTTGATGISADGSSDGNDQTIVEVGPISPSADCELTVDLAVVSGGFAYLNFMYVIESNQQVSWTAGAWTNGSGPDFASDAIIDDNYSTGVAGSLDLDNLTVNTGMTLTVGDGTSLTVRGDVQNDGDIIVESGGSLIVYDGYVWGGNPVVIKRNTRYADGKYSFVGSPVVQNASILGADLGTWVYKYNETTGYGVDGLARWEDAASDELMSGKGYAQAGQMEVIFTGAPNAGTIVYSGSYTQDASDGNEGWNLVANPYASAINLTGFLSTNTNNTGAVYLWDDNGSNLQRGSSSDYVVANASGAINTTPAGGQGRFNGYIGSAQGFFVQLMDGAGTDVVFSETMRESAFNSDDNFFRKANDVQSARINLTTSEGLFKQTLIAWNNDVNDQTINRMYDAPVFNANAEYAIYTWKLDKALAIQTVTNQIETIPLGLNVKETGLYTLSLDASAYNGNLFLKDNLVNRVIDLTQGDYTFDFIGGSLSGRFELYTVPVSVLANQLKLDWKAYTNGRSLILESPDSRTFRVFSISGQFIVERSVVGRSELELQVRPGIYIVSDGLHSKKIIIK